MLSTGKEREIGSVRSAIAPGAGICTIGASLDMSAVPHSSVADPLAWVLLVSVPTQRRGELKEAGPTNVGMHVHHSAFAFLHLLSSIPPL